MIVELNPIILGKVIKRKMMKNLAIILFAFLPLFVKGQISEKGWGIAFQSGVKYVPVKEYNAFFSEAPGLNPRSLSFAGEIYKRIGAFSIGLNGMTATTRERVESPYIYQATSYNANLRFLYDLLNSDKYQLAPVGSIGFGRVSYLISESGSIDLERLDGQIIYSGSANWTNIIFTTGVSFQRIIKSRQTSERCTFNKTVGIELGMIMSPENDNWTSSTNAYFFNAPAFNYGSWYLNATIGFEIF